MACTITQADLGALAEGLDPDVADLYIKTATEIVLGPTACQGEVQLKWLRCCVDPCRAIKLMAQHLIATDPESGAGEKDVLSERVGDVATTYANATSSAGIFGDSTYGRMFSLLLAQYERCQASRRTLPFAVGGSCGCR